MTKNGRPKPKKLESASTGRAGVHHVGGVIEDELDWVFREQPDGDYGIDAHVETVEDESVTGKLLALQIKSSKSKFKKRPRAKGWWFEPKNTHVNYWLDHSLPVVIVLYDRSSKTAYWQTVNQDNLKPVKTKPGKKRKPDAPEWRIFVPEDQIVGANSRQAFAELADGDPYILRLRQLRLATPWMELLQSGRRILFDIEEWIHKSSGRGSINLRSLNEDNADEFELGQWTVILGGQPYKDVLPRLFPWGTLSVHEETYEDEIDRDESHSSLDLRPYEREVEGEVDLWRLEVTLNEVGKAFLLVDEFARGEGKFLLPAS